MEKSALIPLIDKYLAGTANKAEQALLETYYSKLEAKGVTTLSIEEEEQLRNTIFASMKDTLSANPLPGGVDTPVVSLLR